MASEGFGEMFEGDSADTYAGKFRLVSMGGRAVGLACADPGARTPISASGNLFPFFKNYVNCNQILNRYGLMSDRIKKIENVFVFFPLIFSCLSIHQYLSI
jgi:hypothetical protein